MPSLLEEQGPRPSPLGPPHSRGSPPHLHARTSAGLKHCPCPGPTPSDTGSLGLGVAWTSRFFKAAQGIFMRVCEILFYGAQDKRPFSPGFPVPSPCGRCGGWEGAEELHFGFQHLQRGGGHNNPTVGKKQVSVGCGDHPVPKSG